MHRILVREIVIDAPSVHLDIETGDVDAEVLRLIDLGAVKVVDDRTWTVMRDLTGLLFDVVAVGERAALPSPRAVGRRLRRMTEYQVTLWRELPSMVAARTGDEAVKAQLPPRFQEAIDEAAMRLGDTGADDYLAGWTRSPWTAATGTPAEVLDRVIAELDVEWPVSRVARYLDGLGR